MPPEYFVTRKKCLRKKLFQLINMLYFKCIQSKLQHTTSQSITRLQAHITTSEAFLFYHLSLIQWPMPVKNSPTVFCPFSLAMQRYLSASCKVLLVLLTLLAGCSPLASIITVVVFLLQIYFWPPSVSNCNQLLNRGYKLYCNLMTIHILSHKGHNYFIHKHHSHKFWFETGPEYS